MKKSIITALLALCPVAAQAATATIDFGRSDATTEGVLNIGTDVGTGSHNLVGMDGSLTFAYVGGGSYVGTAFATTKLESEEANWKEAFSGTLPFDLASTYADGLGVQRNGGKASITLSFTGLTAGTYSLELFGGYTGKDKMAATTYTISGADASAATWNSMVSTEDGNWTNVEAVTGSSSGQLTADFFLQNGDAYANATKGIATSASNIVVGESGSLTLTIEGNGDGFERVALNYLSLTYTPAIPEPTTATLSLLALAGLAARRRRK